MMLFLHTLDDLAYKQAVGVPSMRHQYQHTVIEA